ncbi:hypothetical protein FKM82_014572 [Ascaphus truei]
MCHLWCPVSCTYTYIFADINGSCGPCKPLLPSVVLSLSVPQGPVTQGGREMSAKGLSTVFPAQCVPGLTGSEGLSAFLCISGKWVKKKQISNIKCFLC